MSEKKRVLVVDDEPDFADLVKQYLEQAGFEVTETDLGEWIVQLAGQTPSHIIVPAIHLSRGEIADLFVRELDVERTDDPAELTAIAPSPVATVNVSGPISMTVPGGSCWSPGVASYKAQVCSPKLTMVSYRRGVLSRVKLSPYNNRSN